MVTTFYPSYHFGGDAMFVRALARGTLQLVSGQKIVLEPKMTLRAKKGILMTVRHRHEGNQNSFHE